MAGRVIENYIIRSWTEWGHKRNLARLMSNPENYSWGVLQVRISRHAHIVTIAK